MEQGLGPDGSVLLRELTRSAAAIYGGPPSPATLRALANHYGPCQGYWAHYLRAAG
jgi:DNA-3-methyladenine glycosylase II